MSDSACNPIDPRIRRTRDLLHQSLVRLLESRDFDTLSVQEITDAAGVNRATFYAHYPDKFALLERVVAARFHALLTQRGVVFDGACSSAIQAIVLGVCDFLVQTLPLPCANSAAYPQNQMAPHLESAIVAVVRTMLLDGIQRHPPASGDSPELIAATASWAIYGAAREWVNTPNRPPSDAIAATVFRLIAPVLHPDPPTASFAPASTISQHP
jgi:AcrR family transcriptional regulator